MRDRIPAAARSVTAGTRGTSRRGRRVFAIAVAVVVLAAAVLDTRRPPTQQVAAKVLLAGIHLYQHTLSPLLPHLAGRCRMVPSCSRYGEEVVRRFGALRGGWLTLRRLLRCGPWTRAGTVDEPPPLEAHPAGGPRPGPPYRSPTPRPTSRAAV
ncbi:MAG: membrane protein insertion efficiency factor YidD [Acidobacteriota bacterium]